MCRLLQNAATSVLGQELISYAKYLGVKTINVVRREEAVNELKLKGCVPHTSCSGLQSIDSAQLRMIPDMMLRQRHGCVGGS